MDLYNQTLFHENTQPTWEHNSTYDIFKSIYDIYVKILLIVILRFNRTNLKNVS